MSATNKLSEAERLAETRDDPPLTLSLAVCSQDAYASVPATDCVEMNVASVGPALGLSAASNAAFSNGRS